MSTYTAQVGPDNAAKLSVAGPDGVAIFEELPGGVVQVNDLDLLRARPQTESGYLTDDEDGLQIWIDGESYPLFDDFDAAVADALGLQTQYAEAKRAFDRAARQYAHAVAKVVELAGSAEAAVLALGVDITEVVDMTEGVDMTEVVDMTEGVDMTEVIDITKLSALGEQARGGSALGKHAHPLRTGSAQHT